MNNMITDGHRFTFIFVFAILLTTGAFMLYANGAEFVVKEKVSDDVQELINEEYGIQLEYPNNISIAATPSRTETPFVVEFVDADNVVAADGATAPIVLRIQAEPKRSIVPCAKHSGRVAGTITIGTSTYQTCLISGTPEQPADRFHVETTHGNLTFTFSGDDYALNKSVVQTVLATFRFTK